MSKKDLQLLLIVFGILIAFSSWQFVFKANQEKTDKLKAENSNLKVTVSELEVLDAKKEEFLSETDRMKTECVAITNNFASGILSEDEIMYLYNMELVDANEVKVPSVSMSDAVLVPYSGAAVTTDQTAAAADANNTTTTSGIFQPVDEGIAMYDAAATLSFTTTYNGLKNIVRYIYEIPARKAISSVSLTTSENGYLSGSMNLDFYYLTGTEVPYSSISIPGVPTGTENIFGIRNGAQNNNAGAVQEADNNDAE